MVHEKAIPGVVRPVKDYRGWKRSDDRRSIEQKREAVVRGIERSLRGEKGAARLERFDPEQGAPVIRVLYASHPLPVFDGETSAVIDPEADRGELWSSIVGRIRAGVYDHEIEQVARRVYRSIERTRAAKAA